jgi:hypothetical protein
MGFGLGKSEKRLEDEGEAALEETLEGSDDVPAPDSEHEAESGGSPIADAPAAEAQTKESAAYRPEAFRPSFLEDEAPRDATVAASPPPPPSGDTFFVSVTRQETTEIRRFDSPAEAQTFVEHLLEEGLPEEEVAAFSGQRLSFKVSHRPVVKLSTTEPD